MLTRFVLLATVSLGAQAIACDKLQRTTTFLGWSADSRIFAWRVLETCVGCKPKWVMEKTFVRSAGGGPQVEYLTRYDNMAYPRPDLPGLKEWEAWVKRFPLNGTGAKAEERFFKAEQAGVALKPKGGEFCAKKQGVMTLLASRSAREWEAPNAACGCARPYPSPDGAFVAWITGPAKRVCDDCHGAGCCGEVEGLLVEQGS